MEQWTAAHGIDPDSATDEDAGAGAFRRREYKATSGEVQVETIEVLKMEHALPIDPGAARHQCGRGAPYFALVGVCAAYHVSRFWGLDR
jgi:poly(3-hydroxybutyrate) depolymerase